MDGFPDPDEEYELLHADELEVLNEFDGKNYTIHMFPYSSYKLGTINQLDFIN